MSKFIDLLGLSRFLANCRAIFRSKEDLISKNDLDSPVQSDLEKAALAATFLIDCVDHLNGSDPVSGKVSQTFVDLVTAAGGIFNPASGYFEIEAVKDITKQEMDALYARRFTASYKLRDGLAYPYRVCLPFPGGNTQYFLQNSNIEYVPACLPGMGYSSLIDGRAIAERAYKLKIWNAEVQGSASGIDACFQYCYLLEFVNIKGLNKSMSFAQSPNLTPVCVAHIVNNASSATISITLHADAYNNAIVDDDVQIALSNHTNVSLLSA